MSQAAIVILCVLLSSGSTLAQTSAVEPFKITDNSFFVEEAFNQERGVFQNIFGAARLQGNWTATFTQEWPVTSQAHQFSYTVAWLDAGAHAGAGDTLLNYRYQASEEGPGRVAISPRASLILPSGRARNGLGWGSPGLQLNVPVSKQTGDWYWHWNGGMAWLQHAEARFESDDGGTVVRRASVVSPFVAGSAIYRLKPMLHLMMESVASFEQSPAESGKVRDTVFTLSPGFRGGWNVGDKQVVAGFAAPISWSADTRVTGAFLYLSYELPFRR